MNTPEHDPSAHDAPGAGPAAASGTAADAAGAGTAGTDAPGTAAAADALIEQVRLALHQVIDPELGYNIVDLGLVYGITVEEGDHVHVSMTTTTRGCPATNYLMEGASNCAIAVDGVEEVAVELTYDPPWNPGMASRAAKQHLGIDERAAWS